MKISFVFLPVLLVANLLLISCGGNTNSVRLQDNIPTPEENNPNNPGEKPEQPTPSPTTAPEEPTPTPSGQSPSPSPTPSPSSDRVARFICEGERQKETRSFNTLRGDVVSNYVMPSLIPYVGSRHVLFVKSPVPLQSDGTSVFFILRAKEDGLTPWKVYKATGDLFASKAKLQVLSNYPGAPPKGGYVYENFKLERRILGANVKRSAYVFPDDNGTYLWESLRGTKFALPFSAETAFNPVFVGGDDYVRFDQERAGTSTLTQKFYHFDSKKTLSLPPPVDAKDSQLFGYMNNQKSTLYWVEGRPEGTWKLRALSLRDTAKVSNLGTLPGTPTNIRLPMVILESKGEPLVAYNEEEVGVDKNAQTYLKLGAIRLVKANSQLGKISSTTSVDYSEELKRSAKDVFTLKEGILGGLLLEPLSGKLYASILSAGGLASFDLRTGTWQTHAMFAKVYGCFNPDWGIEVIND